ncbi:O-antigen ligase family protein [Pelagibacterales bacterium SAG-MED50]|nr:O-antigen ligase family protein [Pelagibacterales bacterium SAG-MED50]
MKNLKYSNVVIINLIVVSIIPFLIWGPFFPDLIVSTSTLFFLYYAFKNKNFYYFFNKPLIIFFIFCIYCILLSIFVAKDTMFSFKSSLFYFRIGVFSCFIWYLIDKDKKILTYFYYALILCFSALVIDGYFQFFTGENLSGIKLTGSRVSSFFGDELIMGSYLSRLFPLLFALFLIKQKHKFEIYFIGILFILVDTLIYMSTERTAFFFLNISTIFIVILIKEYQKFRLLTFIIAIFFISVLSISSPNLSDRMFKDPAKNMGLIKNSDKTTSDKTTSDKPTIFTPAHDSLIRTAYNMFKDQPLFGHGPRMFRIICKEKKYSTGIGPCMTHPHNFYVQLLAETGAVGFLFIFSILGYVSYAALRQLKSIIFKQKRHLTDYQVCLLAGILITIWPFSPNGNFFHNWLMITYSLPIGFYLQSIYSKTKN